MVLPTKSRKSRWLSITALVILFTVWLFTVPGLSDNFTIYPTADATVYSSLPDHPFGADTSLWVEVTGSIPNINYSYAYFKFDLSSLPKGEVITAGILCAYCYTNKSQYPVECQLRAVSDNNWIESGPGAITWNNKPAYDSIVIDTRLGLINKWCIWGIPGLNLPATGLVSFVLTPGPTNGLSDFYSRESSNKPFLIVTTIKPALAGVNVLLLSSE